MSGKHPSSVRGRRSQGGGGRVLRHDNQTVLHSSRRHNIAAWSIILSMVKRHHRSAPPEGSLRALGGDGQEWHPPRGKVGVAAKFLLNGSPDVAAASLVQGEKAVLDGLTHLVDQNVLTPKQCDLILTAAMELSDTQQDNVRAFLARAAVKRMIATASTEIGIAISDLLIENSGEGGIDAYA